MAMGHRVVVADNLSTGNRDAVPEEVLVEVDIADEPALDRGSVLLFCQFDRRKGHHSLGDLVERYLK
jgi:hypothetical protein